MPSFSKDRLFLSASEVVAAIGIDFDQYDVQAGLYCDLIPLVFGTDAIGMDDPRQTGLWFKAGAGDALRLIPYDELGRRLLDAITALSGDLKRLAEIAARIFEAPAGIGLDPQSGDEGLWIDTGMEDFVCRQCGRCCRRLNYHNGLTLEDVTRWRNMGRKDILRWVREVPNPDCGPAFRIWVHPGSNRLAEVCPFLEALPGQECFICRIHAVKPDICRQYPGTRKHGRLTGCIGFEI